VSGNSLPEIDQGENLLLQSSPFDAAAEEYCIDLLTTPPSDNRAVLEVTYLHTPRQRIAAWGEYCGIVPYKWTIITIKPEQNDDRPTETVPDSAEPTTISVPGSNDVSTLGTRITDWLNRYDEEVEEITVCFYSITSLFQYTDRTVGLKFLDSLTAEISDVGARAHFHVDPQAHEPQTREAIRRRFDIITSVE